MRSNGVNGKHDFTSMSLSLVHRIMESAMHIKVNQNARVSGHFLCPRNEASSISIVMFQYAELHIIEILFGNLDAQCLCVESGCSVQIRDRNVEPNTQIVLPVEFIHDNTMNTSTNEPDTILILESLGFWGDSN